MISEDFQCWNRHFANTDWFPNCFQLKWRSINWIISVWKPTFVKVSLISILLVVPPKCPRNSYHPKRKISILVADKAFIDLIIFWIFVGRFPALIPQFEFSTTILDMSNWSFSLKWASRWSWERYWNLRKTDRISTLKHTLLWICSCTSLHVCTVSSFVWYNHCVLYNSL